MVRSQRVLVTGAGGFIGHHLVKSLVARGHSVRGVDLHHPEYEPTPAQEFEILDLRRWPDCLQATRGVDLVYNLAANMGGIGFIESNKAVIMHDNVLINVHMLEAARLNGVKRYLYLPGVEAERHECNSPPRRGRISGRCRGRLRLGEAVL